MSTNVWVEQVSEVLTRLHATHDRTTNATGIERVRALGCAQHTLNHLRCSTGCAVHRIARPEHSVVFAQLICFNELCRSRYTQSWYDYKLTWDPKEYNDVDLIHVPAENIWQPDIVLFNKLAASLRCHSL